MKHDTVLHTAAGALGKYASGCPQCEEDRLNTMPDVTPSALHEAADRCNDSHDHDELHAAGAALSGDPVWASSEPYIARWIHGLVELHGIPHEPS